MTHSLFSLDYDSLRVARGWVVSIDNVIAGAGGPSDLMTVNSSRTRVRSPQLALLLTKLEADVGAGATSVTGLREDLT